MDLTIIHRSGKKNNNADALSRFPLPTTTDGNPACGIVAALVVESGEDELAGVQQSDEELAAIITYVETGVLPEDQKLAKRIALTSPLYTVQDQVLYRVERDATLRVVPPTSFRRQLFEEAHAGRFGAHLSDTKVHSALQRHYWWDGMRKDITRWSRACLTCVTQNAGRARKPPLSPIPVSGPFDKSWSGHHPVPLHETWESICHCVYGLPDEMAGGVSGIRSVLCDRGQTPS